MPTSSPSDAGFAQGGRGATQRASSATRPLGQPRRTYTRGGDGTWAGKSDLAGAIRHARSRWTELTRYLDDGRLEISNNAAENQIRPLKVGAKNWFFAGSDTGAVRAAAFYTIIRTAVLNGVEPEAYLTDVIARIGSHPINRLTELMPWDWQPPATQSVAA